MNSNLLGEQIAKYRKAAHLTQEGLGRAVGVSTQAVSRWERGGAPDVTLLPAIADALHVTVDTLFGREEATVEDTPLRFIRWLESIPDKERLNRLFELLAGSFSHLASMDAVVSDIFRAMSPVLPSCYTNDGTWLRSWMSREEGIVMGVFGWDFPFCLLLPEPSAGYASQFAPMGDYRALFSVLSREGALELLCYLHSREMAYYTVPALSDRIRLPAEQVGPILEAMEACRLVKRSTIETQSGSEPVYALHDKGSLIPFLYLARWLMAKDDAWYMQWADRERPILAPANSPTPESK